MAILGISLVAWVGALMGQTPPDLAEGRNFKAAVRTFQIGSYDIAKKQFSDFVQAFPLSSQVAEAILYQARSALKQQSHLEAVSLLATNSQRAGTFADEYAYWLAQANLQISNYVSAAEAFARVARQYPNSARLLEAGYGEALARFQLRQWPQVIELLGQNNGTFQTAARTRTRDELTARGRLLLAEAFLEQHDYSGAQRTLASLPADGIVPELQWYRQYLVCRLERGDQRPRDALRNTTNLVDLAGAAGLPNLLAESFALRGAILTELNEPEAAIAAYTNNLATAAPPDRRRDALLEIIELTLAENKIAESRDRLTAFLAQYPDDSASGVALFTLGEIHLKQYLNEEYGRTNISTASPAGSVTNHLQLAFQQFDKLAHTTNAPVLAAKASLNRGWCFWLDGKFPESTVAFREAVEQLPRSEDRALAQFKLADAYFLLKDYTNAVRGFRTLVADYDDFPRIKSGLFDHALYQTVRASIELKDLATASDAALKLLRWYPYSFYGDRSVLLLGQNLATAGHPQDARGLFQQFVREFPASRLTPEISLAVARTYERESDWAGAARQYDEWVGIFYTNALLPRAEFGRAVARFRLGDETNALQLFTNFVGRFVTNEFAPLAQMWIGDYFFRQANFVDAQKAYQAIVESTNWPVSELTLRARMNAGRSAFARQGWKDAAGPQGHFTLLVNDNSRPAEMALEDYTDLKAEAYFALGDTMLEQESDSSHPLQRFAEARDAFAKIPQLFPTNARVAAAWGKVGDCYLQLASQDSKLYAAAIESYQKVVTNQSAVVGIRSQAELGIGLVLEKQAATGVPEATNLVQAAFEHYFNIVSGKVLRDRELPDPRWFREASLAAARLAEDRRDWTVAANVYQRLVAVLPVLRPAVEKKIERARNQMRQEKTNP